MRAGRGLIAAAVAAAGVTAGAAELSHYRAAQAAAEAGDCPEVIRQLSAFLDENPYLRAPEHRGFYLRLRRVMKECEGTVVIRGIGEDGGGISPLSGDPPPE